MTKEEIKKTVIDIIYGMFPEANLDKDMVEYMDLIQDIGMDSISYISIIVEIEAKFEIIVPDECLLMENFRNINKIVDIVTTQLPLHVMLYGEKSNE